MKAQLSRLDYVALAILLGAISLTAFEWYRTTVLASHNDKGRHQPADMSFGFQLRADQGIRSLPELIAEEEAETGATLRIRRDAPICKLSFLLFGPHNGSDLIIVVSPIGTDPTITRDFIIPQGKLTDIPLSRETAPTINPFRFRTDGVTNASIYWAYCD